MISANAALSGSYDYGEVARSVLIAIAASYAGLDLAGRVTAARGRVRLPWLSGGAIAMGIGIWAMHLKGMLAFHLPVPIVYHWPTVLAALLVAIFASAVALYVTSRPKMGGVEALTGSIIMGAGIAGLHYGLMAAMRMPAITRYSAFLVTCSILLAILFSLIALLMAFGLREETRGTVPRKVGSAIVMGIAISAMHYTGMAAASFFPGPPPDLSDTVSNSPIGGFGVVMATLIVLVAAIVTSSVDRRAHAEIQRLNQDLERRVAERTLQLEMVNQSLRKEIAERERAEDAVRRSEDRLRLVIDTTPAMLHSARPDGYLDFFNKRWLEYLGVSLDDLLGWRWTSVIHPDDLAQLVDRWQTSLATGKPFEAEARLRRADGEYRLTLHRKVPLRDETGSIVKWYGSVIDIEDRKRAEEALRESRAELARVTRIATMGELTASIAHEINQPLGAVVTNGNAALRWLAGQPPNLEEAREAIDRTVREANRAGDVIGRIRALLQKTPPRMERLDVNEVIREVLNLVDNELLRGGVTVRTELAADVPAVRGDRVQLRQVLLNLILNGVDAMGTIADRPRELLIKSARHPDGVLIQVHDSGAGVDPEQAGHIFEPFFTTKPQGIGMGLSVSRSIVEAHGGRLWFTPGASNGVVFEFTVPKAD
ncbi:MAG: MHYT domain-containing protein [Candidatus Sulfotelmatobacter sp.]